MEDRYLTGVREAALLGDPDFRQRCAEAIAGAIETYAGSLNGQ